MPEMRFRIEWPDGEQVSYYSPSLVVKEHIEVGGVYEVEDFVARVTAALEIASERVRQKYGSPCSLARAEAARLVARAGGFRGLQRAKVRVLDFTE